MEGRHLDLGAWHAMLHGFVFGIYEDATLPRGGRQAFFTNMMMLGATRPAGRRHAGTAGDGVARAAPGREGIPAAAPDGRERRRHQPPHRPPASARPVHGVVGERQPAAGREVRGVPLSGLPGRTGARAAGVHAPPLGRWESARAAQPSLARLHPHHLRRRHGRGHHRPVQGRCVALQWPRTRQRSLELRHAAARLAGRAHHLESGRRPVDAGQCRLPERPRGSAPGDRRTALHRVALVERRSAVTARST